MILRPLSKCLLKADRHGASTTSLGIQFQALPAFSVKNCFLLSSLNLLWERQLWATCPGTGSQGEEISISLCTSPPQEAAENDEVVPQPPSFQARQAQCPQPLLIAHALQPCHQLCYPPLARSRTLACFLNCGAQFTGLRSHTVFPHSMGMQLVQLEWFISGCAVSAYICLVRPFAGRKAWS